MRGVRLNGWQRIGIVLSVVWALGAWLYVQQLDVEQAQRLKESAYRTCTDLQDQSPDKGVSDCIKDAESVYDTSLQSNWSDKWVAALLPIPIAWMITYGLIGLVRWIRAGFAPEA